MAGLYESLKNRFGSWMGTAAQPIQSTVPALTTTQGSTSLFGTAPETPGYTSTGGRRHGKTRRHRKGRKSLRRRR
jgi:hypothetical protein